MSDSRESRSTEPVGLVATPTNADVGSVLAWRRLPTYGPGGDRQRGGGGRQRGGGELLGPELVVADEAVGRQAEVRQELDQELVTLREHRPARVPPPRGAKVRGTYRCVFKYGKKKTKTSK